MPRKFNTTKKTVEKNHQTWRKKMCVGRLRVQLKPKKKRRNMNALCNKGMKEKPTISVIWTHLLAVIAANHSTVIYVFIYIHTDTYTYMVLSSYLYWLGLNQSNGLNNPNSRHWYKLVKFGHPMRHIRWTCFSIAFRGKTCLEFGFEHACCTKVIFIIVLARAHRDIYLNIQILK